MKKDPVRGQAPQHNPEFLKERKFRLIIPLLILPFMTMAFWALGGGKHLSRERTATAATGLNTTLPQARFKGTQPEDKMDVYRQARRDSAGSAAAGVSPAFLQSMGFDNTAVTNDPAIATAAGQDMPMTDAGETESRVREKLAQINRQLNQRTASGYHSAATTVQEPGADVKRLEKMMKAIDRENTNDPEMEQLNDMVTKLAAIQHPETNGNRAGAKQAAETAFRAIPAVIDGKQKVKDGATVRLKLTDSVMLKGVSLPKGQLLYGACQVTNQRLLLNIRNIRIGKKIIPADLTVFSLDGMPGIPAPEAELAGAAGSSADNAVAAMQVMSMDNSIGAQAAAGGINAVKSLFSKKIGKIKVKLDDQLPVLLRNNSKN
ncbi:conjugative transposon protein TraM [Mucilaginibacter segetis]|uniref:Conjugative transposon protein TraM n=1 Tax=Mucilaginibacter segetis TaxID=2793071 RepID=A0A934PPU7_9SPHI|nr:conjugative transposon protein TraM [Mucilaginibacter segetis]MBK0378528.1 conjugative transposon protein TraM [Mucilaginibacter segetis]